MENNVNDVSRIASGTVFKGEITSASDIRVDGFFDGRINTKGRLVTGEKAVLKGDLICNDVDFSGTMSGGTFYVKETLVLKPSCSVNGDLRFKRLQVDLDAKLKGNCKPIDDAEFERIASGTASVRNVKTSEVKSNDVQAKEQ